MSKSGLYFATLLLGFTITCSSPAGASCTVPYNLTNGQVADADQVMDNFDALGSCSVSTTGTPTNGSLTVFSGTKTIASGNLSGDVTTSGSTATSLAPSGVTPGSYTAANITVDAKGRVTAASSASGTGGTAWTLAGSWTWSANVANIDVTGLGSFNELLIIGRNISASISGNRSVRVSVDNGSTFFSAPGDYKTIDINGGEASGTAMGGHSTAATAARSFVSHILNLKGDVKVAEVQTFSGNQILFTASTLDINAVRITSTGGGALTGGHLLVYAR